MARWWWRDGRADARQGLVRITTWTSGNMVAKRQNGDQHLSQLARSDRTLAWPRTEVSLQRYLHSLPRRDEASGDARRTRTRGMGGRSGRRSRRCITRWRLEERPR